MSFVKGILDYFDLNKDLEKYSLVDKRASTIPKKEYDEEENEEVGSNIQADVPLSDQREMTFIKSSLLYSKHKYLISLGKQFFMYIGIVLGVFFSLALTQFENGELTLNVSPIQLVISAGFALVIIPLVYKKLDLNRGAPIVVQFGLFFQNGFFWHVLISTAGKIM